MEVKKNKLIVILFLIGLFVLAYPHVAQIVNNSIQKSKVDQFHKEARQLQPEVIEERVASARRCNESIFHKEDGFQDPFTEGYSREEYQACKDAPADGAFFATLEIPDLNISIPIYLGASEDILSIGVGQVEGSSLPVGGESTHTVLAAHRGMGTKEMFRHLDKLQEGDTFNIHTVNETLRYRVYDTEIILPHETEALGISEGKDQASLITCHPYGSNSHRLTVHAERME